MAIKVLTWTNGRTDVGQFYTPLAEECLTAFSLSFNLSSNFGGIGRPATR
jgi:hypothetical protein